MTRMTQHEQEERLRLALRAAAESVEPAADGLERIRERLTRPRPLAVAWLMAGWSGVAQPAMLRIEPFWGRLGGWLSPVGRLLHSAVDLVRPLLLRLRPTIPQHGTGSASPAPRYPWLRLAAAIGVIVVIAFVGGFVLTGLPHTIISQVQNITSSGGSRSSGTGHGPAVTGSGTPAHSPSPGQHKHNATPSPSASCSPAPAKKRKTAPSPAPSKSPSPPSPSPTPTPSVSPTPSPTPSPSATSGSNTSPTPTSGEASLTAFIVTGADVTGRPQQASKPSPSPTSPCSSASS
jgi:hypothetical protein